MQKIIIIVITAMLIFTGCGTSQPETTPTPQAATPTATQITTQQPTNTPDVDSTPGATATATPDTTVQPVDTPDDSIYSFPQILVDAGNIFVAIEDFLDYDSQTVEILFTITNDTGDDYVFSINAISVNNIVMPLYPEIISVSAGYGGLYSVSYSKYALQENGIEDINDIHFNYSMINVTDSVTEHQGTYHIGESTGFSEYDISQGSTLAASNEYINVYWISANRDSYGDEYYGIIVENKNDVTLNLNMTGIAINSVSVPSALNTIMLPNSIIVHRGYVSGEESSFLTDVESAKKVEVEFMGNDRLTGSNQFVLSSAFVFDETFDTTEKLYDGQIIYNVDDISIGIKKLYDYNNLCDKFELYIANNKETTAYININEVLFDDGPVGSDYTVSVLAGTHATQVIILDEFITDDQYEMSLQYDVKYNYNDTAQPFGLSFILE